jgi:hypothetical protein
MMMKLMMMMLIIMSIGRAYQRVYIFFRLLCKTGSEVRMVGILSKVMEFGNLCSANLCTVPLNSGVQRRAEQVLAIGIGPDGQNSVRVREVYHSAPNLTCP